MICAKKPGQKGSHTETKKSSGKRHLGFKTAFDHSSVSDPQISAVLPTNLRPNQFYINFYYIWQHWISLQIEIKVWK